ncbi:hypothetical protein [Streptomyces sp. B21-083]|uniref:hypothetical protein n=1 Tax=Streptomyces sp. B21-083 TaxID=3039410 RepID=UPI003FA7BF52
MERHDCPNCDAPAGRACRTRSPSGKNLIVDTGLFMGPEPPGTAFRRVGLPRQRPRP